LKKLISLSLITLSLIITLVILLAFFKSLPIEDTTLALDWKTLWLGVRGAVPTYGNETGLRIPPWSVIFILPLGLFSFRESWGLLSLATLITLLASVPRGGGLKFWISSILLAVSFPSLRTIADGNLEFLIIAGLCILIYGLVKKNILVVVAGSLLAATKVQESWILLMFLPLYAYKNWTTRELIKAILFLFLVIVPSLLWHGKDWIDSVVQSPFRGTIMDSSMISTLTRFGFPGALTLMIWMVIFLITMFLALKNVHLLSREKISFLISASLLLAPYAAGNNFLTILAIGVIPLLSSWPKAGIVLFILSNLPFVFLGYRSMQFQWSATYWTFVILLSWGLFGIAFARMEFQEIRHSREAVIS